ncbi:MAG: YbhB/YbcL family Raf kinase inhibitor-like protein [Candidatus Hydrogenedentes bacterium]|nr:YbhB/YbcL family Raf kinase inhibitor-like protein [Candidatus Hydrogenedentota bacterium]
MKRGVRFTLAGAAAVAAAIAAFGAANAQSHNHPPYPPAPVWNNTIQVTSEAFAQGEAIPMEHTKDGANVSPAIAWSRLPEATKEVVVMLEDPDGTGGNFNHWLVYGISPEVTNLPSGLPAQAQVDTPNLKQGTNSMMQVGYLGPAPVPGSGVHHYTFRVFALDHETGLDAGANKEELQNQMYKHVLAQGVLSGTYERKK